MKYLLAIIILAIILGYCWPWKKRPKIKQKNLVTKAKDFSNLWDYAKEDKKDDDK